MPLGEVTNNHMLSGSRIMDMDSLASGLREVSSQEKCTMWWIVRDRWGNNACRAGSSAVSKMHHM